MNILKLERLRKMLGGKFSQGLGRGLVCFLLVLLAACLLAACGAPAEEEEEDPAATEEPTTRQDNRSDEGPVTVAPASVSNLRAYPSSNGIRLEWTNPDAEIASFDLTISRANAPADDGVNRNLTLFTARDRNSYTVTLGGAEVSTVAEGANATVNLAADAYGIEAGESYSFSMLPNLAGTDEARPTAPAGLAPRNDGTGGTNPAPVVSLGANYDGDEYIDEDDPDVDGDGVANGDDSCPGTTASPSAGEKGWVSSGDTDNDGDGCRDTDEDPDDDNDGVLDGSDSCSAGETEWISSATTDNDGDGCRDTDEDPDDDNDGVLDGSDSCSAGETGWRSSGDTDNDGDGCRDVTEDPDGGNPDTGGGMQPLGDESKATNLAVSLSSATSISLSWRTPAEITGLRISGVTIRAVAHNNDDTSSESSTELDAAEYLGFAERDTYEFTGLDTSKAYSFYVTLKFASVSGTADERSGLESDASTRTPAVPAVDTAGKPANLRVALTSLSSARLTWRTPDPIVGVSISNVTLRWVEHNPGGADVETLVPLRGDEYLGFDEEDSYEFTDVNTSKAYSFYVGLTFTHNAVPAIELQAESDASPRTPIVPVIDETSKPTNLVVALSGAEGFRFSWNTPAEIAELAINRTTIRIVEHNPDGDDVETSIVLEGGGYQDFADTDDYDFIPPDTTKEYSFYVRLSFALVDAPVIQLEGLESDESGRIILPANVPVLGDESKPTNLVATLSGAASVSLSWRTPDAIEGLSIRTASIRAVRHRDDGSTSETTTVLDGNDYRQFAADDTYELTGLDTTAEYSFHITITFEFQPESGASVGLDGLDSDASNRTPVVPVVAAAGKPTNLMVSLLSLSSARLTWRTPDPIAGVRISGVTIRRVEHNSDGTNSETSTPLDAAEYLNFAEQDSYEFADVNTSKAYSFYVGLTFTHDAAPAIQLQAESDEGPRTPIVPVLDASSKPTNLVATLSSTTSISLSWRTPPEIAGLTINKTTIRVVERNNGGTSSENSIELAAAESLSFAEPNSYELTGLEAAKEYSFYVRLTFALAAAPNIRLEGLESDESARITLPPDVPVLGEESKATNLVAILSSPSSAILNWLTPPPITGLMINGVTIRAVAHNSDGTSSETSTELDDSQYLNYAQLDTYEITGLDTSKAYSFYVTLTFAPVSGTTDEHSGLESDASGRTPLVPVLDAISKPTNLAVALSGNDGFRFSWSTPAEIDGLAINQTTIRLVEHNPGGADTETSIVLAGGDYSHFADTDDYEFTPPDASKEYSFYVRLSFALVAAPVIQLEGLESDESGRIIIPPDVPALGDESKPTNLVATLSGATSVSLSWRTPDAIDGLTIGETNIHALRHNSDGSTSETTTVLDGNDYRQFAADDTYELTGLDTTAPYSFHVTMIFDFETTDGNRVRLAGLESDASAMTPIVPAVAAAGKPTSIVAAPASTTSISLSWRTPNRIAGISISGVTIRIVEHNSDGTNSEISIALDDNQYLSFAQRDTYDLTGLDTTTKAYSFYVGLTFTLDAIQTIQLQAESDESGRTPIVPVFDDTTSAPTTPTVDLLTASRAQLSWRTPNKIAGFSISRVRIRALEHSEDGTPTGIEFTRNLTAVEYLGSAEVDTYVFTGLDTANSYSFHVRLIYSPIVAPLVQFDGLESGASIRTEIVPKFNTPTKPIGLRADMSGSSSITLSWRTPDAIDRFRIQRVYIRKIEHRHGEIPEDPSPALVIPLDADSSPIFFGPGFAEGIEYTQDIIALDAAEYLSFSQDASYEFTGLDADKSYTFYVSLIFTLDGHDRVRVAGTRSDASNRVFLMLGDVTGEASKPTNVAAVVLDRSRVSLSWRTPARIEGFAIDGAWIRAVQHGEGGAADTETIVRLNAGEYVLFANDASYEMTGLDTTKAYSFYVRLEYSLGAYRGVSALGTESDAIKQTPRVPPLGAATQPTNLAARVINPSRVALSWVNPAAIADWRISEVRIRGLEHSTDGSDTREFFISADGAAYQRFAGNIRYEIAGLDTTKEYSFHVTPIFELLADARTQVAGLESDVSARTPQIPIIGEESKATNLVAVRGADHTTAVLDLTTPPAIATLSIAVAQIRVVGYDRDNAEPNPDLEFYHSLQPEDGFSQQVSHSITGLDPDKDYIFYVTYLFSVASSPGLFLAGLESDASNRINAPESPATEIGEESKPVNLVAAASGDTSIMLNWTTPDAIAGFSISGVRLRALEQNSFGPLDTNIIIRELSTPEYLTYGEQDGYEFTGLDATKEYSFYVTLLFTTTGFPSTQAEGVESDASNPVDLSGVTRAAFLAKPTEAIAIALNATNIELSWRTPAEIAGLAIDRVNIFITSQSVSYGPDGEASLSQGDIELLTLDATEYLAFAEQDTYEFANLDRNTTYSFILGLILRSNEVSSEVFVGGELSDSSNAVDLSQVPTVDAASKPINLEAIVAAESAIELNWKNPAALDGYRIRRVELRALEQSTGVSSAVTLAAPEYLSFAANSSYEFIGLDSAQAYSFSVQLVLAPEASPGTWFRAVASDASNTVDLAQLPSIDPQSAPTSLAAILSTPASASLTWNTPAAITGLTITGARIRTVEYNASSDLVNTEFIRELDASEYLGYNEEDTYEFTGLNLDKMYDFYVALNFVLDADSTKVRGVETATSSRVSTLPDPDGGGGTMPTVTAASKPVITGLDPSNPPRMRLSWRNPAAIEGVRISEVRITPYESTLSQRDNEASKEPPTVLNAEEYLRFGEELSYETTALAYNLGYSYTVTLVFVSAADPNLELTRLTSDRSGRLYLPQFASNLVATMTADTSIRLAWTTPGRASGNIDEVRLRTLEHNSDGSTSSSTITLDDAEYLGYGQQDTYEFTGLDATKSYSFYVTLVNSGFGARESAESNLVSLSQFITIGPESQPTGITAAMSGASSVSLNWRTPDPIAGFSIAGVRIRAFEQSNALSLTGKTITRELSAPGYLSYAEQDTYEFTGLNANKAYTFYVTVLFAPSSDANLRVAGKESDASARIFLSLHQAMGAAGKPTNVKALVSGSSKIRLSWRNPDELSDFAILGARIRAVEHSGGGAPDVETIIHITGIDYVFFASDTSYELTGLDTSKEYSFYVSLEYTLAINPAVKVFGGESDASNRTPQVVAPIAAPTQPGNLVAALDQQDSSNIMLSWNTPVAIAGWRISGVRVRAVSLSGEIIAMELSAPEYLNFAAQDTYAFPGLVRNKPYTFYVTLIFTSSSDSNIQMIGEESVPSNIISLAQNRFTGTVGRPTDFAAKRSLSNVILTWKTPDINGFAVAGARIRAVAHGEEGAPDTETIINVDIQELSPPNLQSGFNQYEYTGLDTSKAYSFYVSLEYYIGPYPSFRILAAESGASGRITF